MKKIVAYFLCATTLFASTPQTALASKTKVGLGIAALTTGAITYWYCNKKEDAVKKQLLILENRGCATEDEAKILEQTQKKYSFAKNTGIGTAILGAAVTIYGLGALSNHKTVPPAPEVELKIDKQIHVKFCNGIVSVPLSDEEIIKVQRISAAFANAPQISREIIAAAIKVILSDTYKEQHNDEITIMNLVEAIEKEPKNAVGILRDARALLKWGRVDERQ